MPNEQFTRIPTNDPGLERLQDNLERVLLDLEQSAVGFRATKRAAQSIPNTTFTKVTFDTMDYNEGSEWIPSEHRFVAQNPGLLHFDSVVSVVNLAANQLAWAALYLNGSIASVGNAGLGNGANSVSCSVSGDLYLRKNDYVDIWLWHSHGGALNTDAAKGFSWVSGHRVRR